MTDSFGARFKKLRVLVGKSQIDVARELSERYPSMHASQTTISAFENRETAPRGAVLAKLADYFGVSAAYFVTESDSQSAGIATTVTPYEMHFLDLYRREQYAQLLREIADCICDDDS